jgi:hypothetical protein
MNADIVWRLHMFDGAMEILLEDALEDRSIGNTHCMAS